MSLHSRILSVMCSYCQVGESRSPISLLVRGELGGEPLKKYNMSEAFLRGHSIIVPELTLC